jgi:predicted DNA-binding transcriptional regulator YafY
VAFAGERDPAGLLDFLTDVHGDLAMPAYTRVHRLLRLVLLVQTGRHRAKELADLCGTSTRNIYRDLKELEGAGLPVRFDRRSGCYRLEAGFHLPPMQLAIEECLAISLLAEQLGGRRQLPFLAEAMHALRKIEAQLPAPIRERIEADRGSLEVRTAAAEPFDQHRDVYEKVRRAIRDRAVLEVAYEPATSTTGRGEQRFSLEPYALFFSVRAWYVVGRRQDTGDLRSLKLSRFASIKSTGDRYRIPKSFSLDAHLGNAWRMIRGGSDAKVELRFDAEFAATVSDTIWHRTQEVRHHADGSCTLEFTVSGLDEISWWVLSMGPHCEVVRPKALADRVRDLAAKTVDRYAAPAKRRARR